MQGVVGISAQDRDVLTAIFTLYPGNLLTLSIAGQVGQGAGDHCHPVPALDEVPGEFVMAGSAGLVESRKSLMDQ